jgi:Family of unknown function (DUF6163)
MNVALWRSLPQSDAVQRGDTVAQTPDRSIRSTEPVPAIRIGAVEEKQGLADPGLVLTLFMRFVAIVWLLEGLAQWMSVLSDANGTLLVGASVQRMSAIVFFCILDLIAAVGLWLAASWGGVIWLVAVGGQLLSLGFLPGLSDHPWLVGSRDLLLVGAYLFVAIRAGRAAAGKR